MTKNKCDRDLERFTNVTQERHRDAVQCYLHYVQYIINNVQSVLEFDKRGNLVADVQSFITNAKKQTDPVRLQESAHSTLWAYSQRLLPQISEPFIAKLTCNLDVLRPNLSLPVEHWNNPPHMVPFSENEKIC